MTTPTPAIPAFDHIFVVIMENHGYDEIIGSADAPYLNQLADQYGVAANYTSVAHPSLPNYLALTGGDTYGVTTDCTDCFQSAPNLAVDRIAASGRTWRAYMESMPSPAFVGDSYPYMQKHDPFIYYDNIRTNPAQLANVVPYTQLATDLATAATTPAFGWITPNMLDDMHDGTVAQGDTWLSTAVPALLACARLHRAALAAGDHLGRGRQRRRATRWPRSSSRPACPPGSRPPWPITTTPCCAPSRPPGASSRSPPTTARPR